MNKITHISFLLLFCLFHHTAAGQLATLYSQNVEGNATFDLPLGTYRILHQTKHNATIRNIFDEMFWEIEQFVKPLLSTNEQFVAYNPLTFKEDYSEENTVYEKSGYVYGKESRYYQAVEFVLSSKSIYINDVYLKLAIQKPLVVSDYNLSAFLLSVKNDTIIDSKRVYYHRIGEAGFTYGRRFYIDKNFIISTRDYAFTEDGIEQEPFCQYLLNSQGMFTHYYRKNGAFRNDKEQGLVKNHTREGKWIEIKFNNFWSIYNDFDGGKTYLEAEYKEGMPVGEWEFYKLEYDYDENEQPILSTRRKGELLYRETYENGALIKRESVK